LMFNEPAESLVTEHGSLETMVFDYLEAEFR